VRSTRGTSSGDGLFRTFATAPTRKRAYNLEQKKKKNSSCRASHSSTPAPTPIITSRETQLASQFLFVAGHKDDFDNYLSLFGEFLCLIPGLLHQSELVYQATSSLVNAMVAYTNRTDENVNVLRKSNADVTREIRSSIVKHNKQGLAVDVIVAIRVMYFVEVMSYQSCVCFSQIDEFCVRYWRTHPQWATSSMLSASPPC
jgi:hypothetical protein